MFPFPYKTYVFIFVVGFAGTLFITPFVRRLALRVGAIDKPGGRKVHERPTPLLGGLALLAPFIVLLGALSFLHNDITRVLFSNPKHIFGLVLCGTLALVLGVYDDVRGVSPLLKLLSETAIAVIAFGLGFRIRLVSLPLLGEFDLGMFGLPLTILWAVGVTNAMNLIDGLDGLAAGTAFFVSASNFFMSLLFKNQFMAVISVLLMGTLGGFLRHNFPPASIFLGDTGSLFLGMVLSLSAVLSSQKSSTAVMLLAPIVALGLPILDTMVAVFRRTLLGLPIFKSDRNHIHHALLDLGLTRRKAVLTLYAFSLVLAACSLFLVSGRTTAELAVVAIVGLMSVLILRVLGYTKIKRIKESLDKRFNYRERMLLSKFVVGEMARARSFDRLWELMVLTAKELGFTRIELVFGPGAPWRGRVVQLAAPGVCQTSTGSSANIEVSISDSSSHGKQPSMAPRDRPSEGDAEHAPVKAGGLGTLRLIRDKSEDPKLESYDREFATEIAATFGRHLVRALGRAPYEVSQDREAQTTG
jgi:UDP-GlcNAc:undecaprenyl-phosphate GlcNAc-1-phosphate transferase